MINYIEKQSKSSKLIILKSSLRLLVTTLTHTHTHKIMVFLSQLNQLEIIKNKPFTNKKKNYVVMRHGKFSKILLRKL